MPTTGLPRSGRRARGASGGTAPPRSSPGCARAARRFGQDWAVVRAPLDAVAELGAIVRPRVQLDRLPPGLEEFWDDERPWERARAMTEDDARGRVQAVRRPRGARGGRAARPEPGPGQVRIRVAAATVNPADTLFRSGGLARGIDGPPPWVAGPRARGRRRRRRRRDGLRARRAGRRDDAVPAARARRPLASSSCSTPSPRSPRVPDGLDLVEAATVPMTGLTVRLLLDTLALPAGCDGRGDRRGRRGRRLRGGARAPPRGCA